MRAISVRISDEMVVDLDQIARITGASISEVVREAICGYLSACRTDERFQARLREQLEKDREALERLAG
ncbi:MAG TPA: ribbon-helix-helix protein, CopG family [Solirubrobacterales bacterium]|nr:ribbon-helix-helix protein, CopG family [Solirubrobacterales bacterium]